MEVNKSGMGATLYYGGPICMHSHKGAKYAEAAVVRHDKFIFVGSLAGALAAAGQDCTHVNLDGRTMTPSFFEAHAHPNMACLFDLREFTYAGSTPTPKEYIQNIREYLAGNPGFKSLRGGGWEIGVFADAYPTKEMLDEVSTEIPIFLRDVSLHTVWVNSKALELAGVLQAEPGESSETFPRDEKGEAIGVVVDLGTLAIEKALPPVSVEEEKALILKFQNLLHERGVTGHMCALVEPNSEHYAAYRELLSQGKLKMYSQLAFCAAPQNYKEAFEWLCKERAAHKSENTEGVLELGLTKFFIDGIFASETAYLIDDYASHQGWRGEALWPTDLEAITEAFRLCAEYGFRIHIHAIGDAATHFALDALEAGSTPNRHGIAHNQLVCPEDFARYQKLEIIANINSYWFAKGVHFADIELAKLGYERSERMHPSKSFYDAGIRVTMASDYPVTADPNPLGALYVAVNRTCPPAFRFGKSAEECTLNANEAVTIDQAFDAFSLSAAYAYGLDEITGSIEAGKSADFVIWDQNILRGVDLSEKLLETWFKGELVYKAK